MSRVNLFSRTDTSMLGQWWWTVDRLLLYAILALMLLGALLSFAGSPLVATRLKLDSFYFVKRHFLMLVPSLAILLGASLLNIRQLRRLSFGLLVVGILLLILTLFIGSEIKGARRWIAAGGFSIQPSELVKPAYAVLSAWLISLEKDKPTIRGRLIATGGLAFLLTLLILQPDLGMCVVLTSIWFVQIFLSGIPLWWIFSFVGTGCGSLVAAYFFLPHVTSRIDRFLDPTVGDQYQISQSIEAFINGGFFGQGPGEGVIKRTLPDAHADFIFSVAAEEFGALLCIFIVGLFGFIVIRGFQKVIQESNLFIMLATAGLLVQFGIQSIINMASSLHLIPTKGMTLPFLSYGGSSLLTLALGMGMVLSLTRRRGFDHV